MQKNILTKTIANVKKLFEYNPSTLPDPYVLNKRDADNNNRLSNSNTTDRLNNKKHFALTLKFAYKVLSLIEKTKKIINSNLSRDELNSLKTDLLSLEEEAARLSPLVYSYESQETSAAVISKTLTDNIKNIQAVYRLPRNSDVVLRQFELDDKTRTQALLVYMEGLADSQKLTQCILKPLLEGKGSLNKDYTLDDLIKNTLPSGKIRKVSTLKEVEQGVNVGDTALFINGFSEAIVVATKGNEHRSVSTPKTEQTIRGSLSAFTEDLRVNTSLVRYILRSSDLVTEPIKIGKRGQLNCVLMYIDSIANTTLVNEVRRRLNGISTDYVNDSAELVQFIEDSPTVLIPQTLSTERPDRVATHLSEGRVALILEGNPFAQVLPVSFFSFFHSAEDFSVKSGVANFMRMMRFFGVIISTLLPALYLSINYFHPEALPSELLLAIAGSRENVPFPAWLEVMMMELSFELIREAGVRIPGLLSSTIGIVGAIILGQAAVLAKIVSPIVVVIVAITGLASFTIPEYRMSSAVRLIRFALIGVAATTGLVGMSMVLVLIIAGLCRMKSFGMPYMTPVAPRTAANYDVVVRGQVFNQETRPDALYTKDKNRQPKVSRKWIKKPSKGRNK